jgi:hypothetical protein
MMDIAIRAAARPGQRHLVYLCAALAGVAAGLVIGLASRIPGRIPADARVVTVTPVPVQQQILAIAGVEWPYPPASRGDQPDPAQLLPAPRGMPIARALATSPDQGPAPNARKRWGR